MKESLISRPDWTFDSFSNVAKRSLAGLALYQVGLIDLLAIRKMQYLLATSRCMLEHNGFIYDVAPSSLVTRPFTLSRLSSHEEIHPSLEELADFHVYLMRDKPLECEFGPLANNFAFLGSVAEYWDSQGKTENANLEVADVY